MLRWTVGGRPNRRHHSLPIAVALAVGITACAVPSPTATRTPPTSTSSGGAAAVTAAPPTAAADRTPSTEALAAVVGGPIAISANRGDSTLTVLDPVALRHVETIALDGPPHAVALTRDGRTALVTHDTAGVGTVVAIDLATGRKVGEVPVGARPRGIAIDHDTGEAVVAGAGDDYVSLLEVASMSGTGVQATAIPVDHPPHRVAIATREGKRRAFVTSEEGSAVMMIDLDARRATASEQMLGPASAVAVAPDGREVFVLVHRRDGEGRVVFLSGETGQRVAEIPIGRGLTDLVVAADGATLFVTSSGRDANLYQVDLARRRIVGRFELDGMVPAVAIAWGAEPERVLVATEDGKIVAFDRPSGRAVERLGVGRDPVDLAVMIPEP